MEEQTKHVETETGFLHYVSPEEFTVPQETMSQSIKGGLGGLWKRIRNRKTASENPERTEADLQVLPDSLLDAIAPPPDWKSAVPLSVVVSEKPWATRYRLMAYPVNPRDQFNFITELTTRGKKALSDLGIQFAVIPSPINKQ